MITKLDSHLTGVISQNMAKKDSHRFILDNFPGGDSFSTKLKQALIDHG